MSQGQLEAIFIGLEKKGPMQALETVEVVEGCGLTGDRYGPGGQSERKRLGDPEREVTLIEVEAIEALNSDEGVPFEPSESRRNLLTRGVALNHLVGREFRVGPVRLKGLRLCEPCGHLEKLTRPGVRLGLLHRGGLRAQVLEGGSVRVGDPVVS